MPRTPDADAALDYDRTLVLAIELSNKSWVLAGVADLGALARQHQPHAVPCQNALLFDRLWLDKAHRRPPDRLADRFGVGSVVLLRLT